MSDNTVPAHADDYSRDDHPGDDPEQKRKANHDPLVEAAKSHPGEPPNRDQDEFTGKDLDAPDLDVQIENELENTNDH